MQTLSNTFQQFSLPSVTDDPETEIELAAEPLIGWRIWSIALPDLDRPLSACLDEMRRRHEAGLDPFATLSHARLDGIGVDAPWPAPFIEARCLKFDHDPPRFYCECGMWAFKSEEQMLNKLGGLPVGTWAVGKVKLWGRIVEHEIGYRAQYAQPFELKLLEGDEQEAAQLAEAYECEVEVAPWPWPQVIREDLPQRFGVIYPPPPGVFYGPPSIHFLPTDAPKKINEGRFVGLLAGALINAILAIVFGNPWNTAIAVIFLAAAFLAQRTTRHVLLCVPALVLAFVLMIPWLILLTSGSTGFDSGERLADRLADRVISPLHDYGFWI